MSKIGAVESYFKKCLNKGMGDLETMLSGIRYRLESGGRLLDPGKRPPGYRSEKLRNFLKERGARRTTLWGGTAIRGDLDPKIKGHIIEFFKLVNELPSDRETLKKVLEICCDLYVGKVNAETPRLEIALKSDVQATIAELLRKHGTRATSGKIPQGLLYSLLRLKYSSIGKEFSVLTKRTHAGDAQSRSPGDVRVLRAGELHAVFEVKAITLDKTAIDRILPAHGKHDYPLFILGFGFESPNFKSKLNEMKNTFAINLDDYFWTIFSEIAINTTMVPTEILGCLIKIYNEEFCDKIEQDNAIKINVNPGQ